MNRFSTVSLDIPIYDKTSKDIAMVMTALALLLVKFEKINVIPLLKSFESESLEKKVTITAGTRVKAKRNAKKIPATIIRPKSITGLISLTPKEAKAIIVVKAV